MRQALGRLLRTHGYQVALFADAETFLAAHPNQDFACLLLDLHMPGSHGFAVLKAMLHLRCPTPVIVMTGHDEPGTRERALEAGARAYLTKPVEEAPLLEAIQHQLSFRAGGSSC
jgi:FixJ family two-component response regulator